MNELEKIYWSNTFPDPNTGCFLWAGPVMKTGYSMLRHNGKLHRGHRVAYSLFKGTLAKGMDVCHKCDNRLCVNPDHLWLGSRSENLMDMSNKGRSFHQRLNQCKHGHEFTEENTYKRGNQRHCRKCHALRCKKYYERQKSVAN